MGNKSHKGDVKFQHFYFDEVYKRESYGKQLITITRPIMNEAMINRKNIYEEGQSMTKDALFLPQQAEYSKISANKANCCCGADSEVKLTYENFNYLLHSQLLNRMQKGQFFRQNQLVFLFYRLLQGSKQFQLKRKSVGDIRPKNIVCTKTGDIKMINLGSFPWEKTSIDKILDGYDNKTIFFLAPQEVRYVSSTAGRGKFPTAKTQAFSIGLTVLEAATLESSQNLYTMPSRKLNSALLQKRLEKVRERYPRLHSYLVKALEEDENKRMSSGQIWACLKCYSQRITELESFNPNQGKQNEAVVKFQKQTSGY